VALSAFACAYSRVAVHRGWRLSLTCAWVAAALAALGRAAGASGAGSPVGLLAGSASLLLARRVLPRAGSVARSRSGRASIVARMASAAALVAALSAGAGALGAKAGGMLAALPVLAFVLVVFTHREQGAPAAIALLRGMLAGMISFIVFCQLIALLIGPYGVAPAFAVATLAALLTQVAAIYPPSAIHSPLRTSPDRIAQCWAKR
jgi:F0F1-type ATP synthase assembly protein I